MKEQEIILKNVDSFNPTHIFECGQCFRWDRNVDESYKGVFENCVANVKKEDNNIIIKGISDNKLEEKIKNYFF